MKDVAKHTTLSAFNPPIRSLKLHQKPIAAPSARVVRFTNDANGDSVDDLREIIQKLDYLKELGFNVVWPATRS